MSVKKVLSQCCIFVLVIGWFAQHYAYGYSFQDDDPMLRRCEKEWWCSMVARPLSPWPEAYSEKTVEIVESPRLLINIPAEPVKIIHSDHILFVVYEDTRILALEVSSESLFQRLFAPLLMDTSLTMLDIADVLFTKTAKDREPQRAADLRLWRFAINLKSQFFSENVTIFSSKKGSVTCFYWREPGGENIAVFVNNDNPYAFLKMVGQGMNFDEFKKVIGSVRGKEK